MKQFEISPSTITESLVVCPLLSSIQFRNTYYSVRTASDSQTAHGKIYLVPLFCLFFSSSITQPPRPTQNVSRISQCHVTTSYLRDVKFVWKNSDSTSFHGTNRVPGGPPYIWNGRCRKDSDWLEICGGNFRAVSADRLINHAMISYDDDV